MKNFAYALVVFISWGTVGMIYLKQKYKKEAATEDRSLQYSSLNNNSSMRTADANPFYLDHTLLSSEMERIVVKIKSEYSNKKTSHILKNTFIDSIVPDLQVDILIPEYDENRMKLNEPLISYAKELQDRIKQQPDLKITLVGHYYDEDKSLDNYLEALSIAKELKNYLINSFKIPGNNITAISEGDTHPLTSNSAAKLYQQTRIEILTEKLD